MGTEEYWSEPSRLGRERFFSFSEEVGSGVDWDSLPSTVFLHQINTLYFPLFDLFLYSISAYKFWLPIILHL